MCKKERQYDEFVSSYPNTKYVIRNSLNDKSTFDGDTRILILGSCIPPEHWYFFVKNPHMYRRIDLSRGTNLNILRKDQENKNRIRNLLREQRIAFFDICERAAFREESSKDRDIQAFIFDQRLIELVRRHPHARIIAITRDAELILKQKMPESRIQYLHFFRGGRGTSFKQDELNWASLFNTYR